MLKEKKKSWLIGDAQVKKLNEGAIEAKRCARRKAYNEYRAALKAALEAAEMEEEGLSEQFNANSSMAFSFSPSFVPGSRKGSIMSLPSSRRGSTFNPPPFSRAAAVPSSRRASVVPPSRRASGAFIPINAYSNSASMTVQSGGTSIGNVETIIGEKELRHYMDERLSDDGQYDSGDEPPSLNSSLPSSLPPTLSEKVAELKRRPLQNVKQLTLIQLQEVLELSAPELLSVEDVANLPATERVNPPTSPPPSSFINSPQKVATNKGGGECTQVQSKTKSKKSGHKSRSNSTSQSPDRRKGKEEKSHQKQTNSPSPSPSPSKTPGLTTFPDLLSSPSPTSSTSALPITTDGLGANMTLFANEDDTTLLEFDSFQPVKSRYLHSHMHTNTHIQTNTHTYLCTYTHTHTHTHTIQCRNWLLSSTSYAYEAEAR